LRKIAILGVGLLLLTGCDEAHQNSEDVQSSNIKDLPNSVVYRLPDGFRNVVRGCDGHDAVYVTSRGGGTGNEATTIPSSIFVVQNSEFCGGVAK
jgi:hypothetical protein